MEVVLIPLLLMRRLKESSEGDCRLNSGRKFHRQYDLYYMCLKTKNLIPQTCQRIVKSTESVRNRFNRINDNTLYLPLPYKFGSVTMQTKVVQFFCVQSLC